MENCNLCPRKCNVPRPGGYCRMGNDAVVTRAARHDWEEPCISGTRGSGTVFFAGCSLGCVYCQNHEISSAASSPAYRTVDADGLRQICLSLAATGVHNINFVTPTHFTPIVCEAIGDGLGIPVVWNTGGYETVETVRSLRGKVQVFLPDLKYLDADLAARYSRAPDYPSVAARAILEMVDQVGEWTADDDGILQSGVLIRHLVLPGQLDNTRRVIEWVDRTFPHGEVLFSLMGQYTPMPQIADRFPELGRPLTAEEYQTACSLVEDADAIQGFLQDAESVGSQYIPKWGVFEG